MLSFKEDMFSNSSNCNEQCHLEQHTLHLDQKQNGLSVGSATQVHRTIAGSLLRCNQLLRLVIFSIWAAGSNYGNYGNQVSSTVTDQSQDQSFVHHSNYLVRYLSSLNLIITLVTIVRLNKLKLSIWVSWLLKNQRQQTFP